MRTLLFGTTYVDTLEKRAIQNLWHRMALSNLGCDALVVDSCSPLLPHVPMPIAYYTHQDNVGHLSRGGRDGWGRAFCHGLQHAVREQYDYAVHVECDSLCRLDVQRTVERLDASGACVASIPVSSMPDWPETGFMFFSVDWLRASQFVRRYDWESRAKYPEPEKVVRDICGRDLAMLDDVRGMRDDFHELTIENVSSRRLDWLTHAALPIMEEFAR